MSLLEQHWRRKLESIRGARQCVGVLRLLLGCGVVPDRIPGGKSPRKLHHFGRLKTLKVDHLKARLLVFMNFCNIISVTLI